MRKILFLTFTLCCFTSIVWAQTRQISGRVLSNETGASVTGASITIKGSSKGAVSDADGKFTISIPVKGSSTLVFNSIGYTTREMVITNQNNFDIKLVTDNKALEDVVVVGYGTVKKRDVTGAVSSINTADIVRANPVNATSALQGQVPGVVITKTSSRPGQDFTIAIRGENTISSTNGGSGITEPLVVIDGVIGGRLRDINPADIQTIDVLKDASSTAIYGSRGANGVIIITSKRGITGKPKVSVDSYVGQKMPAHLPEMQTAQQFYKFAVTDYVLNGGSPTTFTVNEMDVINSGKSVNWLNELTQPGLFSGNTVAVSGGNAGTTYRLSAGYLQEDGNIPYTNFKKYNVNAAIESRITSSLRVGITAFINYNTNPTGSYEALRSAYRTRPTGTILYKDLINPADKYDLGIGPWNGYSVWMGINDNQVINPIIEMDKANYQYQTNSANEMGTGYLELTLLKGLTFRSSISASIINQRTGEYRGPYTKDRLMVNPARGSYRTDANNSYTVDNQLTYNLDKGKHRLNVTALQSAYKNTTEFYTINFQNLPYASLWYNIGSGQITSVQSDYKGKTLESYMARANYTFNDKYILTLTGRADGASQLAAGNKWAFFPSGAFSWKLGEENFIKRTNIFSDLRVRVSYGQVGNANLNPYATGAFLAANPSTYSFDQTTTMGSAPGSIANKDLKWERSQELNLGLNMGFLNNRISATVEVYNRKTKDLIIQQNLPTSAGFTSVAANVGQISNKGVEIILNTRNISTKDFNWTTTINFAKNINRVEALSNGVSAIIGNSLFVGYPVKSYYDYRWTGIWQLADSVAAKGFSQVPGSVKVADTNGDGVISSATGKDDRQILGTQLPNFVMGMTNKFYYKNFDLSFLFYYRNGTLYKNGMVDGTMGDYGNTRYNHMVMDYWTRNNPTNDYYGPAVSNPYRGARSYEDATFLRLSDVTFGYTMSDSQLKGKKIERMRLYLQVINPRYFTKYHGQDPEYNSNTYIDDVPNMTYTFGMNLGF